MGDTRSDRAEPEPDRRELSTADLIDNALRKLVTTIVVAAAIIGLAIYSRPGPPRYQAVAAPDGRVLRIDTRRGTILACDGNRCMTVVRHGQHLERDLPPRALPAPAAAPAPAAQPSPALPAPATR